MRSRNLLYFTTQYGYLRLPKGDYVLKDDYFACGPRDTSCRAKGYQGAAVGNWLIVYSKAGLPCIGLWYLIADTVRPSVDADEMIMPA